MERGWIGRGQEITQRGGAGGNLCTRLEVACCGAWEGDSLRPRALPSTDLLHRSIEAVSAVQPSTKHPCAAADCIKIDGDDDACLGLRLHHSSQMLPLGVRYGRIEAGNGSRQSGG